MKQKFKGRVQCFSMQDELKFLSPKPWKKLAQIRLAIFEKTQKPHTLIPKNDITVPKARLL